mgnify:FL=1
MSLILAILLAIFFGYSLALVVANNSAVEVNLLFLTVPNTNLGLVLIFTIVLGILIGILLAVLLFKVLQNKLEIRKLHKEVGTLQSKLIEATTNLENTKTALESAKQAAKVNTQTPVAEVASHDSEKSL